MTGAQGSVKPVSSDSKCWEGGKPARPSSLQVYVFSGDQTRYQIITKKAFKIRLPPRPCLDIFSLLPR
jgi:hypothetical protein